MARAGVHPGWLEASGLRNCCDVDERASPSACLSLFCFRVMRRGHICEVRACARGGWTNRQVDGSTVAYFGWLGISVSPRGSRGARGSNSHFLRPVHHLRKRVLVTEDTGRRMTNA